MWNGVEGFLLLILLVSSNIEDNGLKHHNAPYFQCGPPGFYECPSLELVSPSQFLPFPCMGSFTFPGIDTK